MAEAYLDSLQQCLQRFRAAEWRRLEIAGRLVVALQQNGGTAYACPLGGPLGGSLRPALLALPGLAPGLVDLPRTVTPADLARVLRKGDLPYIQGYTEPPLDLLDVADAAGTFTVVSLAGTHSESAEVAAADVVLRAQWWLGDALVPLPGYDVPVLPPSGFMGGSIYWAVVLAAMGAVAP